MFSQTTAELRAVFQCQAAELPAELHIDLSLMSVACLSLLSLSVFQPKGFRRYYSSPLLIQEQYGCIKEVMPIGEQLKSP